MRSDAEVLSAYFGKSGKKGRFAEVVQAMIRAHPDAPVAPVLKEGPRVAGGQAITPGK
jgi:hypothetical protein